MFRRTALVALGLTAVLAPGASAVERDSVTLDGHRKTTHSYGGELAGPTVYTGLANEGALGNVGPPNQAWCQPQTCDTQKLVLQLPRGRQSGRLVIDLTPDENVQMHFVVYDDKGEPLPGQSVCCGSGRYVATRMEKGAYTVVVYDDAGAGGFEVDVTWKANPPHRTSNGNNNGG